MPAPGLHVASPAVPPASRRPAKKEVLWQKALWQLSDKLTGFRKNDDHTYAEVIKHCSQDSQWQAALQLFEDTRAHGFIPLGKVYMLTMNALQRGDQWQRTVELLEDALANEDKGPERLSPHAIIACGDAGNWQMALDILRTTPYAKTNIVNCNSAMNALRKAEQWQHVLELLADMKTARMKPDNKTYREAMNACAGVAHWMMALQFIDELQGVNDGPIWNVNYRFAMEACARAGYSDAALQLLSDMRKQKLEWNSQTFQEILVPCAEVGNWQLPLQLLVQMRRGKIQPDSIHVLMAMEACGQEMEWETSLKLLEEARPDIQNCNAAITVCGRVTHWQAALNVFASIKTWNLVQDRMACNSVIAACSDADWQTSLDLLQEMRLCSWQPDISACGAALNACGSASEWEHSLLLFTEEPSISQAEKPSSDKRQKFFSSAIHAFGSPLSWELAFHTFESMTTQSLQHDMDSYTALICASSSALQWTWALQLLAETQEKNVKINSLLLNNAMMACYESEQWEASLALFASMDQLSIQPDIHTFSHAIIAHPDEHWQRSLEILAKHWHSLQDEMTAVDYSTIMDAMRTRQQPAQSLKLFGVISAARLEPSELSHISAIRACADLALWEEALTILRDWERYDSQTTAIYEYVFFCLAASGQSGAAKRLVDDMERRGIKVARLPREVVSAAMSSMISA